MPSGSSGFSLLMATEQRGRIEAPCPPRRRIGGQERSEDQQEHRPGERWRIKRIDLEQHPAHEPRRAECANEPSGCPKTCEARSFMEHEIADIGAGTDVLPESVEHHSDWSQIHALPQGRI